MRESRVIHSLERDIRILIHYELHLSNLDINIYPCVITIISGSKLHATFDLTSGWRGKHIHVRDVIKTP